MPLLVVVGEEMMALLLHLYSTFLQDRVAVAVALMVVELVDLVLTQTLALGWVAVVLVDILELVVMLDLLMVILLLGTLEDHHRSTPPPLLSDKQVAVVEVVVDKASMLVKAVAVAVA